MPALTRQHFTAAADLVRSIARGGWTFDTPAWADPTPQPFDDDEERELCHTRAVWTAEAFILLFQDFNPHFNRDKFLMACGLMERRKTA